jgi:hypothetical protein
MIARLPLPVLCIFAYATKRKRFGLQWKCKGWAGVDIIEAV